MSKGARKETRIVFIGKTGSGKSSTANTLLGKYGFVSMLSSFSITRKTSSEFATDNGRDILLIDTPGLFDTEIPNHIMKKEIMKCVTIAAPGLHAVVLVTKIGRFTEEEKNNIQEFKKYFGEGLSQYLIIVFTGKDDLDASNTNLENYLVNADPVLKKVAEECCYRCIAVNNRACEAEKMSFKRDFFALVDKTFRRNGGRCYTIEMLHEAEMFTKQAEARRVVDIIRPKERGEATKKLREKHEAQMAEFSKQNKKKLETIKKENAMRVEKLCSKRMQSTEDKYRVDELMQRAGFMSLTQNEEMMIFPALRFNPRLHFPQ